ncbi:MAG: DNA translocase FtsK 4TM domain-containing protein [Roseitalea sp.]|nr:DNA translocase FtsK 4TM domain-containing protein [Roseitalea sp.]MBO6723633.1 DNA translocase FtsK 4TM domain-containing protein [Roseitalea sp.]MBO6744148.1 DNA translocase FtsK 4TM domain-containing protein [Roseitalea sp.]
MAGAHGSVGDWVRRQVRFAAGWTLIGLTGFIVLSLLGWNVADPSLSHATEAPVSNWMGYPGAVAADLAMQFFGLAALAALVPLVAWAVALIRDQVPNHAGRRMAAWLAGALCAAAAIGCLTPTAGWPLPSGLGGALGDMVLRVPGTFTGGYPTGLAAIIVALVMAPLAAILLALASGIGWRNADDDRPFDADEDEEGGSLVTIGAVLHGVYALRTAARRLLPVDAIGGVVRRGPVPAPAAPRAEPPMEPAMDAMPVPVEMPDAEADAWQNAEDWAPQPAPLETMAEPMPGEVAPTRVAAPAPPPKPSVRVQREAQPSLIKDGVFELPQIHYLNEPKNIVRDETLSDEALEQNARLLEGVLEDFGVKGEIIQVRPGPVVTLYELEPAPGIKSSRVIGLAEDIARSMSAIAARVAVVPGRNAIGIELPNAKRETVYLRELISSQTYDKSKAKLSLTLGKTINGEAVIADLAKMPHLLVAGTTGSGKSVAINTMILSLLYKMTPDECRLIMIDPKMLELSVYDGIPHLLTPVVTDPKKAVVALKWTVREMEQRYKNMSKLGVRNIDGFNTRIREARRKGEELSRTVQTGFDRETGEAIYETEALDLDVMPYIVVIIDEMADLMMVAGKDIEGAVQRLAQMARAAGIHVIMATQRPSVDVITGTIKANFPTRISFQVTSKIDSRTILGEQGAEQLLGMGDMLYMAGGGRIQRVHGPFVSDEEVEDVVSHLKAQGVPQYLDAVTEDDEEDEVGSEGGAAGAAGGSDSEDPYDQAVAIVIRDRKASTSYIQRRLGIGYNRAATLIERMEQEGVIGPANHAGKREILVPSEEERMAGM